MLLIDDNAGVRAGVRALLSVEPALRVVADAANGTDGLARARELRPDLIVLDQQMPGLSGLDILPALRRLLPASRVMFFTLSVEVEAEALAGGAVAVVAKEEPHRLLTTLRRLAADGNRTAPDLRVPRPTGRDLLGR
ncbi:MAG: hypothetical protein NVS1B1_08850 [Candidatus Limnocylindrales bacterium]